MTVGTWGYHLRRSLARTSLLKATAVGWWEDKAPRLGAALAFYTVLSLAPMLVIAVPIIGSIVGEDEARRQIALQFEQLAGPRGAEAVKEMLDVTAKATEEVAGSTTQSSTAPTTTLSSTASPAAPTTAAAATTPATNPVDVRDVAPVRPGRWATTISIVVLLFAASGVFAELQDALNTIWEVTPKPGSAAVWDFIRVRFLSFAMVMGICFLLLVSLLLTAALESLQNYAWGPLNHTAFVWQLLHQALSFLVITFLFAMMFKILPDATVGWKDVWLGALLTSGMFTAGRYLIGKYIGTFGVGTHYGAAGSLVVLLVWVYYSAQILLMGAEFTKVYSLRRGSNVVPTKVAVAITEEAREQQGIAHREVIQAVAQVVEKKESELDASAGAEPGAKADDAGTEHS